MDADYAKNGYIAPFYICRIRLESNSSREVLGEFQFPGDYAMKAGENNGFGVYLSDNNIYFYAGGTGRMYFYDNNVQYRVSKYDLSTGQYTELWTYTGDDRVDVFGENTGKVDVEDFSVLLDLIQFLAGGSRFWNEEVALRVEDAELELMDIIHDNLRL